jgi:hypothetical protein
MDQGFAFLDAMVKTLVSGLPIEAAVNYDQQTARLTVSLRSLPDPSRNCGAMSRQCSPRVRDYADLEQYVRKQVSDFIALVELAVPETRRDESRNRHPSISGETTKNLARCVEEDEDKRVCYV